MTVHAFQAVYEESLASGRGITERERARLEAAFRHLPLGEQGRALAFLLRQNSVAVYASCARHAGPAVGLSGVDFFDAVYSAFGSGRAFSAEELWVLTDAFGRLSPMDQAHVRERLGREPSFTAVLRALPA